MGKMGNFKVKKPFLQKNHWKFLETKMGKVAPP